MAFDDGGGAGVTHVRGIHPGHLERLTDSD